MSSLQGLVLPVVLNSYGSVPGGTAGSGVAGQVVQLTANRTLTQADNGTTFVNVRADATAVTVSIPPGLTQGFAVRFIQESTTGDFKFTTNASEIMRANGTFGTTATYTGAMAASTGFNCVILKYGPPAAAATIWQFVSVFGNAPTLA